MDSEPHELVLCKTPSCLILCNTFPSLINGITLVFVAHSISIVLMGKVIIKGLENFQKCFSLSLFLWCKILAFDY
jgi:hypothetical protein